MFLKEDTTSKASSGSRKPFGGIFGNSNKAPTNFQPHQDRKNKFETFLTHRKRATRVALVQSVYLLEAHIANGHVDGMSDAERVNESYRAIIFFYKKAFFAGRYGDTKKTKKLDEKFLRSTMLNLVHNQAKVDQCIKGSIKKGLRFNYLESVVRAILRCAVTEAMTEPDTPYTVIISEYTQLCSGCLDNPQATNFINAVLDKAIKQIRLI